MIGSWNVYLDWKNSGEFYLLEVNFMHEGELYCITPRKPPHDLTPHTMIGKWVKHNGMILWGFNTESTRYSGIVNGRSASGIMTSFDPSNTCGTWYALKAAKEAVVKDPE